MKRIAGIGAAVLLVVGFSVSTLASKGEVTVYEDGNVRPWARAFSVEVRDTLVENWNWTGDNAAKIASLERRVADLEGHSHSQSQPVNAPTTSQDVRSESTPTNNKQDPGSPQQPNTGNESSVAVNTDPQPEPEKTPEPEPTPEPKKDCKHKETGNTYTHGEVWTWQSNVVGRVWENKAKCDDGRVIGLGSRPIG